ncbi:MAG: hypothetical protein ACLFP1_02930 [Candidatus Goldiibacteriota bacterium]
MDRLKRWVFFIAAVLTASPVFPIYEKGGFIMTGAEYSSMGGAAAARSNELFSVFYNPAGLYDLPGANAGAGYANITGIRESSFNAAVSYNFRPFFTSALSVSRFFIEESGYYEEVYSLSGAFPVFIHNGISMGAGMNIKFLNAFYGEQYSGPGLDVGLLLSGDDFLGAEKINIGLSIIDIEQSLSSRTGLAESISSAYKAGILYMFSRDLNFSIGADHIAGGGAAGADRFVFRCGAEKILGPVSVRAGITGFSTIEPSFTAGFGVKIGRADINYAFAGHSGDLGSAHRLEAVWVLKKKDEEYIPPPSVVEAYSGDEKAYVKWKSGAGRPDAYFIYLASGKGERFKREAAGGYDAEFIIDGLENGETYELEIVSVSDGRESEKSTRIKLMPGYPDKETNLFYKKMKVLYIERKYSRAVEEIRKKDPKTAELIIFKDRLKRLMEKVD